MSQELENKKTELEIKIKELELKEKKSQLNSKNKISQSILIAVIAGVIGIIGNIANTIIQKNKELELERKKLNSSLILKAIETNNPAKSIENLKFLLELNLISDEDNSLKNMLKDSSTVIPALFQEQMVLVIKDTTNTLISDLAVYIDNIYIGQTNLNGSIQIGFTSKTLGQKEIQVKKGGFEYEVSSYWASNDSIILTVVSPK